MNGFKQSKIAIMVAGGIAFSGPLQAALIDNGNGFIYDTVKNITWTQDANLLGTMAASNPNLVNQIISANNGVIHDTPNSRDGSYNNYDGINGLPYSGKYTLSANDFGSGGLVDWWAAQAFVNYLNSPSVNYGGSNQWALPTQPDQNSGYNITNSQLGELYYNELNALAYPGTNDSNYGILHDGSLMSSGNAGPFTNVQTFFYWSGTESMPDPYFNSSSTGPVYAWYLNTMNGGQFIWPKYYPLYAWAVSPGNVGAPVPIPGAVWLFGSGLGFLALKTDRKSVV